MHIFVLVSQFERLCLRLCSDDNPVKLINPVCFRLNQVLQKMDEIRESGRMIVTEGGWLYERTIMYPLTSIHRNNSCHLHRRIGSFRNFRHLGRIPYYFHSSRTLYP